MLLHRFLLRRWPRRLALHGLSQHQNHTLTGSCAGRVISEVRTIVTAAEGLPSDDVLCVAASGMGDVFAGTTRGLARFDGHKWTAIGSVTSPVKLLAPLHAGVYAVANGRLLIARGQDARAVALLPDALRAVDDLHSLVARDETSGGTVLLGARPGLFELEKSGFAPVETLNALLGSDRDVRQVAIASDGAQRLQLRLVCSFVERRGAGSDLIP